MVERINNALLRTDQIHHMDGKTDIDWLAGRGYTMVWSGWDFSAGTDNAGYASTMTFPAAWPCTNGAPELSAAR